MKSFLLKSLNVFTIFAMVFMSNIVLAVDKPIEVDDVCASQVFVSEDGVDGGVAVDPIHDAWTASIGGASWVWSENPIADAVNEVTETFTLTFNISGIPTDSDLEIAADNEYTVTINGTELFVEATEDNYSSSGQDSHTIPGSELVSGENTVEFEVTNWAQDGGTMESNPAGLMYKLEVNCTPGDGDDEEDCDDGIVEDNDCDDECENIPSFGDDQNDCDDQDEESGPSCDSEEIWARVVVTEFSNVGAGDVTDTIYLGSDSNTVASGEWFNTAILDAGSIEDFADVEGLAVKRANNNKIVLELHGSHNPQGTGQEFTDGYIEFFNGNPTLITPATGQNKLEGVNDGGHDDVVSILGDTVNFNLGVGTADDRFTTTYIYVEDEICNDEEEENDPINLITQKIVCEEESMLPNWGLGGEDITSTTASDWVTEHVGCDLVENWQFEWALYNSVNPGDNVIGPIGGDWNAFTSSTSVPMPSGSANDTKLWVREVMQEGYIPFEGADNASDVSAEVYCHTDVLNYDNYERLDDIAAGGTYNCVAWNVVEEPVEPSCEETQTCENDDDDPTCEETQSCNDYEEECIENCEEDNSSGGGGSSSGSRQRSGGGSVEGASDGDVLGACVPFTEYHRKGDVGGEIPRIQEFLNEHMNAGLAVDGVYGDSTVKAVHSFQQKYFSEIISPWVPPLQPRTTGRWYKSTRMMANEIIVCSEPEVFLEDPQIMYKVKWAPATTN